MSVLGGRLRERGFTTSAFSYPSRRRDLSAQADDLRSFVETDARADSVPLHFVGHSLGGLVIMTLLTKQNHDLPRGRVVLLGSPVRGSGTARKIGSNTLGRALLGPALRGLESGTPIQTTREVGVIAGLRSRGMGSLLGGMSEPNDGTVSVHETCIADATDGIQLPVSHFGMLLSERVARECAHFLKSGKFAPNGEGAGEAS